MSSPQDPPPPSSPPVANPASDTSSNTTTGLITHDPPADFHLKPLFETQYERDLIQEEISGQAGTNLWNASDPDALRRSLDDRLLADLRNYYVKSNSYMRQLYVYVIAVVFGAYITQKHVEEVHHALSMVSIYSFGLLKRRQVEHALKYYPNDSHGWIFPLEEKDYHGFRGSYDYLLQQYRQDRQLRTYERTPERKVSVKKRKPKSEEVQTPRRAETQSQLYTPMQALVPTPKTYPIPSEVTSRQQYQQSQPIYQEPRKLQHQVQHHSPYTTSMSTARPAPVAPMAPVAQRTYHGIYEHEIHHYPPQQPSRPSIPTPTTSRSSQEQDLQKASMVMANRMGAPSTTAKESVHTSVPKPTEVAVEQREDKAPEEDITPAVEQTDEHKIKSVGPDYIIMPSDENDT